MSKLSFYKKDDVKISYRYYKRSKKTLIFLHGLLSDMSGKKSKFLNDYCKSRHFYNQTSFDTDQNNNGDSCFYRDPLMDAYLKHKKKIFEKPILLNVTAKVIIIVIAIESKKTNINRLINFLSI